MTSPYYTQDDDAASAVLHGLAPGDPRGNWRRRDDERAARRSALLPFRGAQARKPRPTVRASLDAPVPNASRSTVADIVPDDKAADPGALAELRDLVRAVLRAAPPRTRRILGALARGETAADAARRIGVSESRVSVILKTLRTSLPPSLNPA